MASRCLAPDRGQFIEDGDSFFCEATFDMYRFFQLAAARSRAALRRRNEVPGRRRCCENSRLVAKLSARAVYREPEHRPALWFSLRMRRNIARTRRERVWLMSLFRFSDSRYSRGFTSIQISGCAHVFKSTGWRRCVWMLVCEARDSLRDAARLHTVSSEHGCARGRGSFIRDGAISALYARSFAKPRALKEGLTRLGARVIRARQISSL